MPKDGTLDSLHYPTSNQLEFSSNCRYVEWTVAVQLDDH